MIVQERLENGLIKTYSDQNVYIFGGYPEGNYAEVIDPVSMNRTYIETDIPIEEEETQTDSIEDNEYLIAGKILMGVM